MKFLPSCSLPHSRTTWAFTALCGLVTLLSLTNVSCGPHRAKTPPTLPPAVPIVFRIPYHGWSNCYLLRSGDVEAVVVPAIGRIMRFGFIGEENVFWENGELEGKPLDCESKDWINFGGDKTWPSPEADWSKFTGYKDWHPPPAFDCMPLHAGVEGVDLILTSPVDPYYGIRTTRRVHLQAPMPTMTITTTYERVSGQPAPMGIWVITQLKDPLGVYVPLPLSQAPNSDFILLGKERPPSLKAEHGLLSLNRSPDLPSKIGTASGTLLWISEKYALRIDSPRANNAEYPDKGSSAEVYTNPNPLRYVELEMLGPLGFLKPGEKMVQVNRYTLYRRTNLSVDEEARRILGR